MTAPPTAIPTITTPKPFHITFSDADLAQFHRKLDDARLPDGPMFPGSKSIEVEPRAFPTLDLMKGALQHWRKMDMKAFEAELNRHPHFTTSVDWCKQLHFIHQPSTRPNAIPLIFCHGWPGSFLEAMHIAKPLSEPEDPDAQAFHVVIPSLPGYTFSSGPPTKEHDIGDVDGYCRLLDALMRGLGYDRYAAQGGDWGSVHARVLGSRFAKQDGTGCRAVHLNFLPTLPGGKYGGGLLMALPEAVSQKLADWTMSEEERKAVRKALLYNGYGSAYYKIQRERPSQIGFGLIDSPVAILGYLANFTNGLGINIGEQVRATAQDETKDKPNEQPVEVGERAGQIEAIMPNRPNEERTLDINWLLHETFLYWITKSAATSFLPYAVSSGRERAEASRDGERLTTYSLLSSHTHRSTSPSSSTCSTRRTASTFPLAVSTRAARRRTPVLVPPPSRRLPFLPPSLADTGFPNEIIDCPLSWARNSSRSNTSNFTWYAKSPTGGHLASTEKPHIFCAHMRATFAPGGESKESAVEGNYGVQGDEEKLWVKGGSWRKGGLWDEERKKDRKAGVAHL